MVRGASWGGCCCLPWLAHTHEVERTTKEVPRADVTDVAMDAFFVVTKKTEGVPNYFLLKNA